MSKRRQPINWKCAQCISENLFRLVNMKTFVRKDTILIKDLTREKKALWGACQNFQVTCIRKGKLSWRQASTQPLASTPQVKGRKPTKYLRKESRNKGIDIQSRTLYPWKYETQILSSASSSWSIKAADSLEHVINQGPLFTWALLEKMTTRDKTQPTKMVGKTLGKSLAVKLSTSMCKTKTKTKMAKGVIKWPKNVRTI